ncbi:MAG: hypothetical protein AAFO95_16485 [Cyanobacteria bacterium J06600_6]
MKITNRRIYFVLILLASVLWQPGHHLLMAEGMTMNFGVHALITMIPFLSCLLIFSKIELSQ